jgi:hypothetical protein
MKKPKSKNKDAPWHTFPENIKEWTDEDHALGWLLRGLRFTPRSTSKPHLNLFLFPALYVPSMEWFFKWFASEVTDKQNQDAAERLYYLALLSVRNLLVACEARPELFRPIAKYQFEWPTVIGWGADFERANRALMDTLNLGEAAPLNTARQGSKSFSLENPATSIAYKLWSAVEYHRRDALDEREVLNGDPVCSLISPCLPRFGDARKLGLTDEQIKKLWTLQPLSRQNYLEWWELGEPIFIHLYGKDFENHKEFSGYWNGDAYKEGVSGKPGQKCLVQNARALIRRDIKKQIKQAFRSIAPKSSAVE